MSSIICTFQHFSLARLVEWGLIGVQAHRVGFVMREEVLAAMLMGAIVYIITIWVFDRKSSRAFMSLSCAGLLVLALDSSAVQVTNLGQVGQPGLSFLFNLTIIGCYLLSSGVVHFCCQYIERAKVL